MKRIVRLCAKHAWVFVVTLAAATSPGWAVDGVFHINQACAVNSGCFSGDAPGFPVTISNSGSYCVTSDLTVEVGVDGIEILESGVTVNLNGFNITGPGPGRAGVNIGTPTIAVNDVEIRNGTISNFSSALTAGSEGILAANGIRYIGIRAVGNAGNAVHIAGGKSVISDCIVRDGAGTGVRLWGMGSAGDTTSISNTIIMSNGNNGLEVTNGAVAAMSGNKIKDNVGGDINRNWGGMILELGPNQCGNDTVCP